MKKLHKLYEMFISQKIKQKVNYLFLMIIAGYLLLFFCIYYFFLKRSITDYSMENSMNRADFICDALTREIDKINTMSHLIMLDNNISDYLQSQSTSSLSLTNRTRTSLNSYFATFNYINSMYLIRNDGKYLSAAKGITSINSDIIFSDQWYGKIREAAGDYLLWLNGDGAFYRQNGENIISFIRLINHLDTQQPIGILAINISVDLFKDTYEDVLDGNRSYMYYNEGFNALYSDEGEFPVVAPTSVPFQSVMKLDGKNKIVTFVQVPNTSYYLLAVENISTLGFISSGTVWIVAAIVIITAVALSIIGFFISRFITTPIEKLAESMITQDNRLERLDIALPDDEIGYLKNSYNSMLDTVNNLISELIAKEKVNSQLELDALQEQIKPHFLYNTLETIAFLALEEESRENIHDAIETLGDFYRRFLSKGNKEITLREELYILKDYLKIQKLRYEDTFDDEYYIQEDLLDIIIPKLILQPLAENSLYHGIRLRGEKGIIRITAFSKGDTAHIIVYDNGIGIQESNLDQLTDAGNSRSFGLRRTVQRLQYYCNTKDVYAIRSEKGLYTEIELKIPFSR